MDNASHWINRYPADKCREYKPCSTLDRFIRWIVLSSFRTTRASNWANTSDSLFHLCRTLLFHLIITIGPLHDPVTWYKIIYTGEQVAQWDFQNKGRCIVLEVPLCNLLTSIYNFVPCDRVVQRAYLRSVQSRGLAAET